MKRSLSLLVGLLLPAALASAATITIQPPAGSVNPGDLVTIDVTISGGEQISGAQTVLIVGDGGPDLGGTTNAATAPAIISGDILTAPRIFSSVSNTGNQFTLVDTGSGLNTLVGSNGTTTTAQGSTVGASGLLMTFTLQIPNGPDAAGTYALDLSLDNTVLLNSAGSPISGTTVEGAQLVVLPEPATALMLLGALPFMRRRRTA